MLLTAVPFSVVGATWRLPDTYHSAGSGRGTATLNFYEDRDILSRPRVRDSLRRGGRCRWTRVTRWRASYCRRPAPGPACARLKADPAVRAIGPEVGCPHRWGRALAAVAEDDPASGQVVGAQFHEHPVVRKDLDVVLTDLSADVSQHLVAVLQLHPEGCVAQALEDCTLKFDAIRCFCHGQRFLSFAVSGGPVR